MNRLFMVLSVSVLVACLSMSAESSAMMADVAPTPEARATDAAPQADVAAPTSDVSAPAAEPKRELTPAQIAVRDQVRRVLAMHRKQAFNTRDNSATEILGYCQGFGCETEISLEGAGGRRLNGITCLCWGYPCAGYEMLGLNQGRIAARIGYGYQQHPGEFLAMLAMSRVPPDYAVRVGTDNRTVADIIEAEKLACRSGADMSLALIGLSYYVDAPEWKNDLGETWSIERILRDEVGQAVVTAPEGGLNRLMGLSYAVARRAKRGQPIDGQFQRARKYVSDFQEFAMQLQNADGSWGPQFLAAKSASQDAAAQLRSTGRIFEWLAMSLPDQKIEDVRIGGAAEYVARLLGSQRYVANAPALSTREIVSMGHALHGLNIYDERVFKPTDAVKEKPAAEAPSAASRDTADSKAR